MTTQTYALPADSRIAMMIAGFDSLGQPVPMTPDSFAATTNAWSTSENVPPEITGILDVVRALYCHGFFVYELVTVAVQHAFTALEAALAHRLDRPDETLGNLIKRAHRDGLLDDAAFEALDEGARRLRNGFSHARQQQVWSPGMAVPIIGSVFTTITALWP